jgi:hypothetical protein
LLGTLFVFWVGRRCTVMAPSAIICLRFHRGWSVRKWLKSTSAAVVPTQWGWSLADGFLSGSAEVVPTQWGWSEAAEYEELKVLVVPTKWGGSEIFDVLASLMGSPHAVGVERSIRK